MGLIWDFMWDFNVASHGIFHLLGGTVGVTLVQYNYEISGLSCNVRPPKVMFVGLDSPQ